MKRYLYLLATIVILMTTACTRTEQQTNTPLLATSWNLVELGGKPVAHPGPRLPHIRFENDRVSGYDGCNNFFGDYTVEGSNLKFGMIAATRMACMNIDELDIEINRMLSATTRYRVIGNRLELYEGDRLLASFLAETED